MNTATNGYYARVSLGFASKVDTDLIAFVRNVITLMTGNAQYPAPSPTLAALTTSVDGFETKVHDALNGGKIEIAARNAARVDLLSLMRQLAAYVQYTEESAGWNTSAFPHASGNALSRCSLSRGFISNCDADLLALLTSGFDAVRAPSPAGILPSPQNPRLTLTGKSGELLSKFGRVANAANYSLQTATSAAGPWEDYDLSTTSRVIISDLTPGTNIWARACANVSAGASEWSTPTTAMVI